MDNKEEVFRGLVDAIVAHPSTKPHIPTSTREVQLEAEMNRFRVEVNQLLCRLEAILKAFEDRHDLGWWATDESEESPF